MSSIAKAHGKSLKVRNQTKKGMPVKVLNARLKCETVFNSVDFFFFYSKVVGNSVCAIQHRLR